MQYCSANYNSVRWMGIFPFVYAFSYYGRGLIKLKMNITKFLKKEGVLEEAVQNTKKYWGMADNKEAYNFYKENSHKRIKTLKGLVDFSKRLQNGKLWRDLDLKFQMEANKPNLFKRIATWLRLR